MFFVNLLSFIQSDLVETIGLCVLASLCVALVVRFFKLCFAQLDKLAKAKVLSEKFLAIYNTIKAVLYYVVAFVLTAIALGKLMSFCVFPADNAKALAIFYFIPMFYLQFFFDKHLKAIFCKIFGIDPNSDEEKPKEKKQKVFSKKIYYTLDDEGNEVPVEE